jgi:hypothetical protein
VVELTLAGEYEQWADAPIPSPIKVTNAQGYVRVKTENGSWWPEHRLVKYRQIGRAFRPGENVHHKNGFRADNRPENLELWDHHQPSGQRVEDQIAHAIDILRRHKPDALVNELRKSDDFR